MKMYPLSKLADDYSKLNLNLKMIFWK